MAFNEAQSQAIAHQEGPCLVLAGPGSGKTTVLTHRICHLITEGIAPSSILVVTFTKAAATEMRERFLKLAHKQSVSGGDVVTFGTFHAIFFQILRISFGFQSNSVITQREKNQMLRDCLWKAKVEMEDDVFSNVSMEISKVKGLAKNLAEYEPTSLPKEQFEAVYTDLAARMQRCKKVDFDDMQSLCLTYLKAQPEVLATWQKRWAYLLVDEFQDISPVQYELLNLLALPQSHLFVVGDDDQSIYGFRGSDPKMMLEFPKQYPEAKQILLNYNYRCSRAVLAPSLNLISVNETRFDKEILGANESSGQMEVCAYADQMQEATGIVEQILQDYAAGIPFEDMAVLYRTNGQMRLLVEALSKKEIPYCGKERIENPYTHWIAQDIFAYLKLAQGPWKRADVLRILNRPQRGLSREFLAQSDVISPQDWLILLRVYGLDTKELQRLVTDIEMMEKMQPYATLNYIRHGVGYERFLVQIAKEQRLQPEKLFAVFDHLQELSRGYEDLEHWKEGREAFESALEEKERLEKEQNGEQPKGVRLSTLHGAKGLEYRIVYLPDCNEGVCPYRRAQQPAELEEERRLFYVGMTRARERLHISFCDEVYGEKREFSRFLKPLFEYPHIRCAMYDGKGERNMIL